MAERDIRQQKLLYHLTSVENLPGIFASGLMSRASLSKFRDVADKEIIAKRQELGLDKYVPFHWFARNPFDGIVQQSQPGKDFALIAVHRELAKAENWKVITRHPLAGEDVQLLDYLAGVDAINWAVMNERDYKDQNCKNVCMAECLSPSAVTVDKFHGIFVPNEGVAKLVGKLSGVQATVNPYMFNK